ncbi:MAG: anaerobic selenocysteine-containing dehydrogenase, partial [Myxococcota bacterium]
ALLLFALVHALFAEDRVTPSAHIEEADVQAIQTLATPFSPEAVAVATGIDAATIWALARALAVTHKAAVYCRIGACTVEFGTLTNWLTLVLNALTGNLDQVGGLMFPKPFFRGEATRAKQFRMGRWSSRVRGYPEVRGELPIATLADEITTPGEGRVRALVTVAGNPTLSAPDSQRLTDALGELDFMVSVDLYRNETSRHADVVLPVPSALERSHADLAFANLSVRNVVNYSPALFPLPPGLRHEHEILTRLAMSAAGAGANKPTESFEDFALAYLVNAEVSASSSPLQGRKVGAIIAALGTERGPERILDFLLRAGPYGDHFGTRSDGWTLERLRETPHGVDFGALTPALPGRLRTKSGRVELLPDAISTDVGRLRTSLETPREPGFRLIGRRHLRSNNSWMHNLPPLVKGKPRCTLQIHPADVARLGLSELAVVTSRVGRLLVPVEPTDRMMPGVVSLPHGWGHDVEGSALSVAREHGGVNSNELTDPLALDPLSGNAVLNGIPVTIVPG